MSSKYGVLSDVVAVAGSLIAVAAAIRLAWMRRAKWMPPAETVTGATAKSSALICAVVIGVLYLFRLQIGTSRMASLALILLGCFIFSLCVSIYVNTAYSFVERKHKTKSEQLEFRVLGGFILTQEAKHISHEKKMQAQALYENSNFRRDNVWTKGSQAALQVVSTLGFLTLQVSGSLALATVSILFGLASRPGAP